MSRLKAFITSVDKKGFLIGLAVALVLALGYKSYSSYSHFQWLNFQTPQGYVAIPGWKK